MLMLIRREGVVVSWRGLDTLWRSIYVTYPLLWRGWRGHCKQHLVEEKFRTISISSEA